MGKVAVVYAGKYGTTKQYGQWICEETGGALFAADQCSEKLLEDYDVIVFGGAVHAGRILGMDRLRKWYPKLCQKKIAVYAVGLNVEDENARAELRELNFFKQESSFKMILRQAGAKRNLSDEEESFSQLPCFFLSGAYDPAKVSGGDKMMMGMVKKMIGGKPASQITESERNLLTAMEEGAEYTDRAAAAPLIQWVLEAGK